MQFSLDALLILESCDFIIQQESEDVSDQNIFCCIYLFKFGCSDDKRQFWSKVLTVLRKI